MPIPALDLALLGSLYAPYLIDPAPSRAYVYVYLRSRAPQLITTFRRPKMRRFDAARARFTPLGLLCMTSFGAADNRCAQYNVVVLRPNVPFEKRLVARAAASPRPPTQFSSALARTTQRLVPSLSGSLSLISPFYSHKGALEIRIHLLPNRRKLRHVCSNSDFADFCRGAGSRRPSCARVRRGSPLRWRQPGLGVAMDGVPFCDSFEWLASFVGIREG